MRSRPDPAVFSRSLGFIAAAAGCFALGAYAGPRLATGIVLIAYPGVLGCLLALPFAARRSARVATALLLAFGLIAGVAVAATGVYYSAVDPGVMWQAGGVAGMVTSACGLAAYLTLPGLTWLARLLASETLGIALCGMVLMSEYMTPPAIGSAALAAVAYCSLAAGGISLVRRTRAFTSAPLLAASVFAAPADAFFYVARNSLSRAFRRTEDRPLPTLLT